MQGLKAGTCGEVSHQDTIRKEQGVKPALTAALNCRAQLSAPGSTSHQRSRPWDQTAAVLITCKLVPTFLANWTSKEARRPWPQAAGTLPRLHLGQNQCSNWAHEACCGHQLRCCCRDSADKAQGTQWSQKLHCAQLGFQEQEPRLAGASLLGHTRPSWKTHFRSVSL